MQGKVFKIGFRSILKESVISLMESFLKKKILDCENLYSEKKLYLYVFFN
jgi:hypothetical protein